MVRIFEQGKRIFVNELEIKLFCNKNYQGEGEQGIVLNVYKDRLRVRLDNELDINGYKYKDILIRTDSDKMSEQDIKFSFAMQDAHFKSIEKSKLN